MTQLTNPVPLFLDASGALLDAGYIYIGVAGSDPQLSPINVFFDQAMTIPATQPLRTLGGAVTNGGNRVSVFFAQNNYSLKVTTADGALVDYILSSVTSTTAYQPLDTDLTNIASAGTSAYGISLLSLSNQAALQAAVGISPGLATTGGTMSGNITRQGNGVHLYHVNSAYTSGRVYGPEYTTDPTTVPGDVWWKASA